MKKYWNDHGAMVNTLAKSGHDVLKNLTAYRANLWHAATGIATEAGELLTSVKATVIYNKPIDIENIIEELGDLEFYMEQLRQGIGVTRELVIDRNIEKLSKRYGTKYSDQAAQERADKLEDPCLRCGLRHPFERCADEITESGERR